MMILAANESQNISETSNSDESLLSASTKKITWKNERFHRK